MTIGDRTTFADLGVPFPLFTAPVRDSSIYSGPGQCAVCGREQAHTFRLGIGRQVVVRCPACDESNVLRMDTGVRPCTRCARPVEIAWRSDQRIACYDCVRAGRVAFSHDTEFGAVSWREAKHCRTHGIPGLTAADLRGNAFSLTDPSGDGWVAAIIPEQMLIELIQTPQYLTIQGERWLFHCSRPMLYVGAWTAEDFDRESGGHPEDLFRQVLPNVRPNLLDFVPSRAGVYVFRCESCSTMRGHYDWD